MQISLIAACTESRVIGKNNHLPWPSMPADMAYFKKTTLHKTILMGRKTFDSIGRALPQRRNIVITRNKNFFASGIEIFYSITSALETLKKESQINSEANNIDNTEIFIIGGEAIYTETLNLADKLYLTFIHADMTGDAHFPAWRAEEWQEIFHEAYSADHNNPYDYSFIILEKIKLSKLF